MHLLSNFHPQEFLRDAIAEGETLRRELEGKHEALCAPGPHHNACPIAAAGPGHFALSPINGTSDLLCFLLLPWGETRRGAFTRTIWSHSRRPRAGAAAKDGAGGAGGGAGAGEGGAGPDHDADGDDLSGPSDNEPEMEAPAAAAAAAPAAGATPVPGGATGGATGAGPGPSGLFTGSAAAAPHRVSRALRRARAITFRAAERHFSLRYEPLGQDRRFSTYHLIDGDVWIESAPQLAEEDAGLAPLAAAPNAIVYWARIRPESLETFVSSLDKRGMREAGLYVSLRRVIAAHQAAAKAAAGAAAGADATATAPAAAAEAAGERPAEAPQQEPPVTSPTPASPKAPRQPPPLAPVPSLFGREGGGVGGPLVDLLDAAGRDDFLREHLDEPSDSDDAGPEDDGEDAVAAAAAERKRAARRAEKRLELQRARLAALSRGAAAAGAPQAAPAAEEPPSAAAGAAQQRKAQLASELASAQRLLAQYYSLIPEESFPRGWGDSEWRQRVRKAEDLPTLVDSLAMLPPPLLEFQREIGPDELVPLLDPALLQPAARPAAAAADGGAGGAAEAEELPGPAFGALNLGDLPPARTAAAFNLYLVQLTNVLRRGGAALCCAALRVATLCRRCPSPSALQPARL